VAVLKKMVEKTRAENEQLKKTPAFTSADQLSTLQKENSELKVWWKNGFCFTDFFWQSTLSIGWCQEGHSAKIAPLLYKSSSLTGSSH